MDQFEELFRFAALRDGASGSEGLRQQNESIQFVNLLLEIATQAERPVHVVLTMRTDFIGDCDQFDGLARAINDGQFLVPRLSWRQMEQAIVGPLQLPGFETEIERSVVDHMLNAASQERDALPLVQHALLRMWLSARQAPDSSSTTRISEADHYQSIGGLAKALDQHATSLYEQFQGDQGRVAQHLFLCLADRGHQGQLTRRVTTVQEVAGVSNATTDEVIHVIKVFSQPGVHFLVSTPPGDLTPDTRIDISHESLLRQWILLRTWLDEEEQSARVFERLSETSQLWKASKAGLYHSPDLDIALTWRDTRSPTNAWAVRYGGELDSCIEFIEASQRAEAERARTERARVEERLDAANELAKTQNSRARVLRRFLIAVSTAAVISISLFVWAVVSQVKSSAAALLAEQRETEARDERSRAQTLAAERHEQLQIANHNLGLALLERAVDYRNEGKYAHGFLAAGRACGFDGRNSSYPQLLKNDVTNRRQRFSFIQAQTLARECFRLAHWPLMSIGTAKTKNTGIDVDQTLSCLAYESGEDAISIIRIADRTQLISIRGYDDSNVLGLNFSADDSELASLHSDKKLRIWKLPLNWAHTHRTETMHVTRPEIAIPLSGEAYEVAYSSNKNYFATTGSGENAGVWDVESRSKRFDYSVPNDAVFTVTFGPENSRVFIGTRNGYLQAYDLPDGKRITRILAHDGFIWSLAVHPDGKKLASAGGDGKIQVWDIDELLTQKTPISKQLPRIDQTVYCVRFSPDGNVLSSGGWDGVVRSWDTHSWQPIANFDAQSGQISNLEYTSISGKPVLVAMTAGEIVAYKHPEQSSTPEVTLHRNSVVAIAAHPSGQVLASGGLDKEIVTFETQRREVKVLARMNHPITCLTYGPQGSHLYAATSEGEVTGIDSDTGEQTFAQGVSGFVHDIDISRTGLCAAVSAESGDIAIWDVESGEEIKVLKAHSREALSARFSPSGGRVVSTGLDGRLCIFDTSNWGKIYDKVIFADNQSCRCVTSTDGQDVIAVCESGEIAVLNIETLALERMQCGVEFGKGIAITSSGGLIAFPSHRARGDTHVQIWDLREQRFVAMMPAQYDYPYGIAFLHNDQLLAYPGKDGSIGFISATETPSIDAQHLQFSFDGLDITFRPDRAKE